LQTSTARISDAGFTLLELSVVLAIVALAATILMPTLRDAGALRVDAAARRLAETLGVVRDGAILGGSPASVVLDLDRGRWTAGAEESATLPPGVHFRAVARSDAPAVFAGVVTLDLDPAGDARAMRIELADDRARSAAVVVPAAGGRVAVVGR